VGRQDPGRQGRRDRGSTRHRSRAAERSGHVVDREGQTGLVDRLFREESGRAIASLIRVLGDFDLAEEAVQEAFIGAMQVWPDRGIPDNPGAWITTTARNKAIDRLRRDRRLAEKQDELRDLGAPQSTEGADSMDETAIPDDRLRLIFTCCHPAL